jgi:tetratricopeptide (TPR) repeat protein
LISLIVEQPERAAALWSQLDRVASPRGCERRGGQRPAQLQPALAGELVRLELLVELGDHAAAAALLGGLEAEHELREAPGIALRLAVARVAVELGEGRLEPARQALSRAAVLAEEFGPRETIMLARADARVAAATGELELAAATLDRALALARSEADPELELALLREFGSTFVEHHQPARALERLTEAVALSSRLGRADNPVTAELQTILAEAQLELGQIEAAHDSLTQARDGFVITLGPDHPQTLASVEALGRSFIAAGLLGDAQFAFLDLLEVYTDLYGAKHWRTALVKLELGDSLMAMDQHDGARKLYSEALVPLIEGLGPGHRAVVRTAIHLGIAELALGNLDAAEPHCARGRDLAKGLAPGDPLADEAERCLAQLSAAKRKRPR